MFENVIFLGIINGQDEKIDEPCVVNFFLVEAETRRRWDIFQAEVPLYWELAVASLQSSKSDFCSAQ